MFPQLCFCGGIRKYQYLLNFLCVLFVFSIFLLIFRVEIVVCLSHEAFSIGKLVNFS